MEQDSDYCVTLVRSLSRDRFLMCLFAPKTAREGLFALYALEAELAHIHAMVSEEMLGHVRYAWWDESVQALADGKPPRQHPVLKTLARTPVAPEQILVLIERYRSSYPQMPEDTLEMTDAMAESLLAGDALEKWSKVKQIITRHRARYGKRRNSWLYVKLMAVG